MTRCLLEKLPVPRLVLPARASSSLSSMMQYDMEVRVIEL
jgi:hypothetical protein